jgi:hypothetical protein
MDKLFKTIGQLAVLSGACFGVYALYKSGFVIKMAETLKRADVVGSSGIPIATNYGSISKVQTDTGNSGGLAVGQTVNYSASNLPDSSSWAADARVVAAVGQNYGAAIGQSV